MTSSYRIQIFCRIPEAGRAKTRLVPVLGEDGAANLAADLIRRLVHSLSEFNMESLELWYAGEDTDDFLAEFEGIRCRRQQGADLGERMQHALHDGLESAERAILIGTDCPPIDYSYIVAAVEALNDHHVVLGPAEDGGYGLIGVRNHVPDIFSGIEWSTEQVLVQTCRKLDEQKLSYTLLPLIWDVDRPEDLHRYYAWLDQS
ncbi:MAG: glycosyltransferase [Gammaproteobacteria bacterium]|jgi:uncharacterized protein|nr:glycosyltransferase [Gammaproteobacteria bacterium]MBT4493749.1 glycosyltransferase [Gammaproteobacteria bacterium]MBT7371477.1 glycosyltransferase [Gammaproteobacteria bacterium]